HTCNPFAVVQYWFTPERNSFAALERMLGVQIAAATCLGLLVTRSASRLSGHFHDRHYKPIVDRKDSRRGTIGNRPLAWWAVRRVLEYSGRTNIYLAGGFSALFAAYTVAGDYWPDWMGRLVFQMVERSGGIPAITTALVLLAAVPAAFQYGLWDSSTQDRCRR